MILEDVKLSWRIFLIMLYALVVFMPALILIYLYTFNLILVVSVSWATLILSIELTRLSGKPLSKYEAGVIYLACSVLGLVWYPLQWIYQIYFKNSPVARGFKISDLVPDFYSPTDPIIFEFRTFFDNSWLLPITVGLLFILFMIITDISLGMLAYYLIVRGEKLPFPLQHAEAEGIITLTTRETSRLRIYAISSFIGLVYGSIAYGVPLITQSLGMHTIIIQTPWVDFNNFVHLVLPGASLGLSTDLIILSLGLIIPLEICFSIFIGSFTLYFVGNYMLVTYGFTDFSREFKFGMSIADSMQRSLMHFWIFPAIGFAISAGIMPILMHPNIFINSLKIFKKSHKSGGKITDLHWIIMGVLCGTIGSCILTYILVSDFPIWLLIIVSLGWSTIFSIACSRSIGLTGTGFDVPFVNYLVYLGSGYEGYKIWFAPLVLETSAGAPAWCARFKIAELCNINPMSVVKIYLLFIPLTVLLGLLYLAEFWRLAPIPSAIYPGVDIYWPLQATIQSMWVSRSISIMPNMIVVGFLASSALYLFTEFLHLPISIVGIGTGLFTAIPVATGILLLALLKKGFEKIFGEEWWRKYSAIMVAGLSAGEGLSMIIGSTISLIIKGISLLPY
ncbi:MAG: OPT/YSL family transporter [Candidatus Bathyarchaeia archaeon]